MRFLSRLPHLWRFYIFRCKWFGIKLHWIRRTEDEWHTHPWNGFSLILGCYEEDRRVTVVNGAMLEESREVFNPLTGGWDKLDEKPRATSIDTLNIDTGWQKVWWFNRIGAFKQHRTRGNTLTLFIHGPRVNENWFWGEDQAPWRGPQNG